MKREERKAIKEILKISIRDHRLDETVLQILKNAHSEELIELFYEAYLDVVKKEGKEKQSEIERSRTR